jgi:hypothetical protein
LVEKATDLPTNIFHTAQKEVKNVLFSKINLEIGVTCIELHLSVLWLAM